MEETAPAAKKRRRPARIGFGRAALLVAGLALWVELVLWLGGLTRGGEGAGKALAAAGMFVALLPFFGILVYRPWWVFDFFRSIQVGVVNLSLIGLGAVIGVLFQQEDPNQPTPEGGIARLVAMGEDPGSVPWNRAARFAYTDYQNFRHAEAFFVYHLLDHLGMRGLMGFEGEQAGDPEAIEQSLANLQHYLPELRDRFGPEFAIAVERQSETGLTTRAKNAEVDALERRWENGWFTLFVWADRLDLRRVYRSDWFATLWAVLALGVLSNTFRGGWRRLLKPRMWGFLVTHAGVMAIIGGAFYGCATEQRGILELHIGERGGSFQRYDRSIGQFREPGLFGTGEPFQVKLEEFRADHHDVLDVWYLRELPDGGMEFEFDLRSQPKVRVFDGKAVAYDWGELDGRSQPYLRLEVLEYAPKSEYTYELREAEEGEPALPLARLRVEDGQGRVELEQLMAITPALRDAPMSHAHSGTRLLFRDVSDLEEARAMLAEPAPMRHGVLALPPAEATAEPQTMDVRPGATGDFTVGGRRFSVEVLDVRANYRVVESADGPRALPESGPEALREPLNPAARVLITAPSGDTEERWVLERSFVQGRLEFPELPLEFHWDVWRAPAMHRFLLLAVGDEIWFGRVGDPASLRRVPGPEYEVPLDDDHVLVVEDAFARGGYTPGYDEITGTGFFDASPASILLRIETPEFTKEEVLHAGDGGQRIPVRYTGPDGEERMVLLRFREDRDPGQLPVEWRSRLAILKEGPDGFPIEVARGDIRVNDYFHYDGFRFFQTSHDPADPTYSGIGVVYDPGIEWVLFGLFTVMFGTMAVFLIKPLVVRKHRGT